MIYGKFALMAMLSGAEALLVGSPMHPKAAPSRVAAIQMESTLPLTKSK